jgi:hypothetical protein
VNLRVRMGELGLAVGVNLVFCRIYKLSLLEVDKMAS